MQKVHNVTTTKASLIRTITFLYNCAYDNVNTTFVERKAAAISFYENLCISSSFESCIHNTFVLCFFFYNNNNIMNNNDINDIINNNN